MVLGVCRLKDHYAVLGIQSFFYAGKCLFRKTFLYADAGKYAEALRLNVDLSFLALLGTNLVAVSIICSDKPLAVPTCCGSCVVNLLNFFSCSLSFSVVAKKLCKLCILFTVLNKHSCDEYRRCDRPL